MSDLLGITSGVSSDTGVVRDHNEDSYLVKPPLFVVADGMGGHAAGEIASRMAVESISSSGLDDRSDDKSIREALTQANGVVFGAASGSTQGMGTTCALLLIGDGVAHVANVGDSRVYRLRGDELTQLTRDHTLVAEMIDHGLITATQALHDGSSAITRALGGGETVDPDAMTIELSSGDRFVLCSDGLSSMISDPQIKATLSESSDPQDAAQNLVDAAKEAGGEDNVTVIVVDVDLEAAAAAPAPRQWRKRVGSALVLVALVLVVVAVAFVLKTRS